VRISLCKAALWHAERTPERGADLFEAALVLPLLLTLVLGIYVFGRAWDVYQTMTRAAREGVRQVVTTSCATCGSTYYTPDYVKTSIVFPALQAASLDTSKVNWCPPNPTNKNFVPCGRVWLDSPTNQVCGYRISFSYPYTLQIPFVPLSVGTVTLTTQVQMRLENQPATPDGCQGQ
jgi:Flp pilus assembly protein TadG